MKLRKRLIGLMSLLAVLFLLPGCSGRMNVTIKEGTRFPVGSKVHFLRDNSGDPLQLEGRIISYLLADGYELTYWDYDADFHITYGHAGGMVPLYSGGTITVNSLTISITDKYGNIVAFGSMSGGRMNVDTALTVFFSELKNYQ